MDRLECDRMFVAVVEAHSFTGAAVKLGTSSGQASKLVSRLEAELGVRLLNRTTRAVSDSRLAEPTSSASVRFWTRSTTSTWRSGTWRKPRAAGCVLRLP